MIIIFGGTGQVPSIIIWQLVVPQLLSTSPTHSTYISMSGTSLIAARSNNKGTTPQALKCSGGDK